jgi:membrane associated rhomboid family serine protease
MFFLLPVGVEYRTRRYPVVTFTLMGLCTAGYLIQLVLSLTSGWDVEEWVLNNLWLTPSTMQWWTLLTSLFVHAGFFHLLGNMIYLFLFGSCVEDTIGRPRFIALYLFTGLVAEFAHIGFSPDHFASAIPLGGASGAISGCIGAFLLLLARTRIEFRYFIMFFFRFWNGTFFLPAWLVISFWFLEDLLSMAITIAAGHQAGGTAFGAHVGGTLCGLAFIAVEKKFKRPELVEEEQETEEPQPQPAVRAPQQASRPTIRVQLRKPAPAAIPTTADAESATVYLFQSGAQAGPFTSVQVQQMFSTGEIPSDALYWQEGMEDWRTAEELRPPGLG